jgi:hypothetical protein
MGIPLASRCMLVLHLQRQRLDDFETLPMTAARRHALPSLRLGESAVLVAQRRGKL